MKKVPLIFLPLIFISCSATDSQTKKEIARRAGAMEFNRHVIQQKNGRSQKITDFVREMPLEQKIAQLFIENLDGNVRFRSYETFGDMTGSGDRTPLVAGGYLYFSYNIAPSREQMRAFNDSVADYCDNFGLIHPFLCVDQEGGWVSRLKKLSDPLPSNEDVAAKFSVGEAYRIYSSQAEQMADMGFHMNLAPVIEVCTQDNRDFLDGRSFGNLSQVILYGRVCINGYENNGISAVVKHFPGNTNTDPHTGLPEITLPKDELEKSVESFRRLIRANPSAVLMSHARTSAVDPNLPACLSAVWVTQILRNEWGYDGLIFSDDIFMGALADNGYPPEKAVVMAVEAGIDCIMISEKRFARAAAVLYKKALSESDFSARIDESVIRILKFKEKSGIWSPEW